MFISAVRLGILTWEVYGDWLASRASLKWPFKELQFVASFFRSGGCRLDFTTPQTAWVVGKSKDAVKGRILAMISRKQIHTNSHFFLDLGKKKLSYTGIVWLEKFQYHLVLCCFSRHLEGIEFRYPALLPTRFYTGRLQYSVCVCFSAQRIHSQLNILSLYVGYFVGVEFSGGCSSSGVGAMHTPQLYEII